MRIFNVMKAIPVACVLTVIGQLALSPAAVAARAGGADVPPRALANATMALEQQTGGKVLEIRLADEKGAPNFEAAVKQNDAIVYMRIATPSNDVTEINISELPQWMTDYKLTAYMRSIDKAKVPLPDAIVQAEEHSAAPAIGAGLARPLDGTNAVLAYYVETIKGDKRVLSAIDAQTGAFISDPKSLYEPHTPVKLPRRLAP
jgi:uncharacterized membrane protein YkoI